MTSGAGWLGRLSLELDKTAHGTQLSRSSHEGPLRIQRVLTPEGPECPHIYLLHPPGGVVGGDRLQTRVRLGAGAQALITTPAAQKLYRSTGARAEVESALELGENARLEWLPSETLAFPAAEARLATRVVLAKGAAFIGWDVACYGMPARGESFDAGHVRSRFEIFAVRRRSPSKPSIWSRAPSFCRAPTPCEKSRWSRACTPYRRRGSSKKNRVPRVRSALEGAEPASCSVSSLGDLLVVRALGDGVEGVRSPLIRAWQVLRPLVVGREPITPRIWAT